MRDFLFADDCALTAHSEEDLQQLADCFATAAKMCNWVDSQHKKTELAGPKHCSTPAQHLHGWQPTQECRQIQISWQLHKFHS